MKRAPEVIILTIALTVLALGCSTTSGKKTYTQEDKGRDYVGLAELSLRSANPSQALRELIEAEKLAPDLPELHHVRAMAYYAKGLTAEARTSAERAYELSPDVPEIQNTLGRILIDTKQYSRAQELLEKAAGSAIFGFAFVARTNLGILFQEKQDLDQATKHFDAAILDNPQAACRAYFLRAKIRLGQKKHENALQDLKMGTRGVCGANQEAHLLIGDTLSRLKRYEEARKKYVEVTQIFEGSETANRALERLRYLP